MAKTFNEMGLRRRSQQSLESLLSRRLILKFWEMYERVNHRVIFLRVWETLSEAEQNRIGENAFFKYRGTVGAWMALHHISFPEAVIGLSILTSQISTVDAEELARNIATFDPTVSHFTSGTKSTGREPAIEDRIKAALKAKKTVVAVDGGGRSALFFKGKLLQVEWGERLKSWELMVALVQKAALGQAVRWDEISRSSRKIMINRRNRLKILIPSELNKMIITDRAGGGGYRLQITKDQICVIEIEVWDDVPFDWQEFEAEFSQGLAD